MDEVIIEKAGSLGRIRLNRPKALNALTLGMVGSIDAALDTFAEVSDIACVMLTGEGERGLCAGGDVRSLYLSEGNAFAEQFWRDEYRLDARIARFEKPFVAVMDCITMGGGVGLAGHARHRVVTERSRVAMPETGIGYLPDVGATWLLPRAPGETGTYLGLTGEAMIAADAIYAGLADAQVPTSALPGLIADLSDLPENSGDEDVAAVIRRRGIEPGTSRLEALRGVIDRCFAFDTVAQIFAALEDLSALEEEHSEFARVTHATLAEKAPASLVLTLSLLRQGRTAPNLETCLEREFHASLAVFAEGDFREGVRAAVIDKDRTPRWSPATLADVDPNLIARWSAPRAAPVFPDLRNYDGPAAIRR